MVEFNLLPDVKLQYIKARNLKRVVISSSILVAAIFLALFVLLLLYVDVAQKVRMHSLTHNINTDSVQLTGNTNLNKILTIQNQLKTLPSIQDQTPVVSRLFNYLSELTPVQATISNLSINFGQNNATITGGADSLATVNQFVDTLKFTTYNNGSSTGHQAFNTVVLSSFNYNTTSGSGSSAAQYTITFDFDPAIFNSTDNVTLVVPTQVTTRSVIDQPTDLFKSNK